MKIAVIGVYYEPNLGDAIICDCVAGWFKETYPQAEVDVIDITGKKQFPKQQTVSMRTLYVRQKQLKKDYWLTKKGIKDKVYYWSSQNTKSRAQFFEETASKGYDVAVFAGGQLFMDWLALDICRFVECFEKTNTAVYFNACGVGPSFSKEIEKQLGEHLQNKNIRMISSRDDVEKINAKYLKNEQEAIATFDPALWTKEIYKMEKGTSDIIGLGVMYCANIDLRRLTKFWEKLIRKLDANNVKWMMFCNGAIDDYNFGVHVLKKLKLDPETHMYRCAERPEELVEQIASFKGIISFRLHSHIVASSLDIPGVALMWDEKLRFFYRHLKHEERCKTVKNSSVEIIEALEKALEEGYDPEILQTQKEYARTLLMEKIENDIKDNFVDKR